MSMYYDVRKTTADLNIRFSLEEWHGWEDEQGRDMFVFCVVNLKDIMSIDYYRKIFYNPFDAYFWLLENIKGR